MHTPLEPLVSVAESREDSLTIHTASQSPSFVRIELARLLGWPENRIRVRAPFLGGGFGAKLYIKLEALVAVLALLTRRPVKVSLTMEEQFFTITKHATTFRIKSGVTKDGRITARQCEVWWNGGAYADIGPRVTQKSGFTAPGPYDIEHVAIDSYALYTNLPPAGALRGFGIPQLVWAYESHTDMMARALKMDPLAFRRKNLLRDGRPQATGTLMQDAALGKVLDRLETLMDWERPFDRGSRTGPARARDRDRLQGLRRADHLGGDGHAQRGRERHRLLRHRRHGPGLRHRHGADRRRGAPHARRVGHGRPLRYRRDALRHGDARLAVAVPHGQRRPVRGRGRAREAPRARGRGGTPAGDRPADRRRLPQALRHAGGQRHRHGELHPELHAARLRDRAHAERDAVLDGRGRRRRGGGGHRDRPRADRAPRQRRRRRHADQPEDRRRRRSRARRSCSSASRCSRR